MTAHSTGFARSAFQSDRHAWPPEDQELRFEHKTERECRRCGMVKVTRHEPGVRPWIEYWRNGEERIVCDKTPPCPGRKA